MHRRAIGLLLAAAALPFTPAFAQDQPTGTDPPPIIDTAPPPVTTTTPTPAPGPETTAPAPLVTTPPPIIQRAPTVTAPAPTVSTPTATTPVRRSTRASTTTRTVTRQASPARAVAPAVAATAPAPLAAQPAPAAEPAPLPAEALPVETLPADTATTIDTSQTTDTGRSGLPTWAWLLAGLGLAAILLGLLTRRRRRVVEEDYVREEAPLYEAPVRAEAPADFGSEYQAPIVAPAVMATAPLADSRDAFADVGEPQIEFEMRPVRAGVGEDDARVEFELGVTNRGTGTARDVRVSAWMLGANSPARSEAEDALIERVDIGAGEDANVEASVGLPRSGLKEDAIIPVVVAEATYRRPDGSEGRSTATYQVGVPDGEQMIYFDVENPSGLHDGVVAREIEELERA